MTRPGLLFVTIALGVAGCGSSGSSKPTAPPTAPGGGAAIEMKNISFSPRNATVKVGQKVTWTNKDAVQHNVIADSGASFKSDAFGQNGTYSFTPTKAGTIKYECTLHPGMTAVLTVTG
jgi:plastocyanin